MNVTVVSGSIDRVAPLAGLAEAVGESRPAAFTRPRAALDWLAANSAALVLLEHPLPRRESDGFIGRLRRLPEHRDTPVVMVARRDCSPTALRADASALRADGYFTQPVDARLFASRARDLVARRRARQTATPQALIADLQRALQARSVRERGLFLELLQMVVGHDGETSAHCLRVGFYARAIAQGLGVAPKLTDELLLASPLHDLGKVAVKQSVLTKPGAFTPGERETMRDHAAAGKRLLENQSAPLLTLAADVAVAHHERWDGAGYPYRLAGAAIPLAGRITAVADVFDALVSERPYKRAWTPEEAVDYLCAGAGRQFDPDCIRAFRDRWQEIFAVRAALTGCDETVDHLLETVREHCR